MNAAGLGGGPGVLRTRDTIMALASGGPPAAIAVVRVSGPDAHRVAGALLGGRPLPTMRRAGMRALSDPLTSEVLDHALALAFGAPASATGEDVVEFHLHGGTAVIAGVLDALGRAGARPAEPGEFTRRAFDAGRLDLSQAEGLADLLAAESAAQRRLALASVGGTLARAVAAWRETALGLFADLQATLDFADAEPDVAAAAATFDFSPLRALADDIRTVAATSDAVERVRGGLTIVAIGPVNVGKSSLLNALAAREASIVSALPGTTRDLVETPIAIGGVAVTLVDTAGLREEALTDAVEREGMRRATARADSADLILDLGVGGGAPSRVARLRVVSMIDRTGEVAGLRDGCMFVSARTGAGLDVLRAWLVDWVRAATGFGDAAVMANARQALALRAAADAFQAAAVMSDPVLQAEYVRLGVVALGRVSGAVGAEDVLDRIFGRFCIGK